MSVQIPDLWSERITVNVLSPVAILLAQQESLKRKTQGVLGAELIARKRKDGVIRIHFDIRAPAVLGYRQRLLTLSYKVDQLYPTVVTSSALLLYRGGSALAADLLPVGEDSRKCSAGASTQEELLEALRAVFQAPAVESAMQSLIARSNEVTAPLAGVTIEPLENGDDEAEEADEREEAEVAEKVGS